MYVGSLEAFCDFRMDNRLEQKVSPSDSRLLEHSLLTWELVEM